MVQLQTRHVREPIVVGEQRVNLVTAQTSVSIGTKQVGFGATYRRPIRVESEDLGGVPARIRDHVMITRATVVALTILALTWRMLR